MDICEVEPIQQYVIGFIFNLERTHVALIRKNRPKWQAGMLNAVGGKIEEDEDKFEAMIRECEEETTVHIPHENWDNFGKFLGDWGEVECFSAEYHDLSELHCNESENIEVHEVASLYKEKLAPNINFLVPMAMSDNIDYAVIRTF